MIAMVMRLSTLSYANWEEHPWVLEKEFFKLKKISLMTENVNAKHNNYLTRIVNRISACDFD